MTKTILVLGGARSGKSRFAEEMIGRLGGERHYIATGRAFDDEMRERIALHREQRGEGWTTLEEALELVPALVSIDHPANIVLVDCLTLWVTNLMMEGRNMQEEFSALEAFCATSKATLLFVSNEVGLGIVPDNRMAREFRDHAGRLNQRMAACAGEVYFIAAGLPLALKGA